MGAGGGGGVVRVHVCFRAKLYILPLFQNDMRMWHIYTSGVERGFVKKYLKKQIFGPMASNFQHKYTW